MCHKWIFQESQHQNGTWDSIAMERRTGNKLKIYYQLRSFSEGAILCLLLLLIDLGLTIPTEVQMRRFSSIHEHQQEDTTRKTEGQMTRLGSNNELQKEGTLRKTNNSGRQHDSRQSDFILDLLINITEQEGMERAVSYTHLRAHET